MNLSKLPSNLPIPVDDGACNHLNGLKIPEISLPNQDGIYLKINRQDTFRLVLYCYPMTGFPNRPLPKNWDNIPGARGCTPQNISFRDNYEKLMKNNAIPMGLSTQSVVDIKEMVVRLKIPYDIISDSELIFSKLLNLPTFSIDKQHYIKRLTIIIKDSIINKVFYPVFPSDTHIFEVINWLKEN